MVTYKAGHKDKLEGLFPLQRKLKIDAQNNDNL